MIDKLYDFVDGRESLSIALTVGIAHALAHISSGATFTQLENAGAIQAIILVPLIVYLGSKSLYDYHLFRPIMKEVPIPGIIHALTLMIVASIGHISIHSIFGNPEIWRVTATQTAGATVLVTTLLSALLIYRGETNR